MDINFDDPKVKEFLDAKVKEATTATETDFLARIKKLEDKNSEIIGEKRDVTERLKKVDEALGGRELDDVVKTLDILEQSDEAKMIAEGKLEEVVEKRIEKVRADFEGRMGSRGKELEEWKSKAESLTKQIETLVIDQAATNAFISAGGIPEAVSDAVFRARQMFVLEDGEPIPRDKNGETVQGSNGTLSIKEFMESGDYLKGTAKHLYGFATGTGATGNNGTGGATKNPWSKEHFNLTRQGEITKSDPGLAAKLKSEST